MNARKQPAGRAVPADPEQSSGWWIYRGIGEPHEGLDRLPEPPQWRRFDGGPLLDLPLGDDPASDRHLGEARAYQTDANIVEMVNAALYLRRPLLVTGGVGTGKSTLSYHIAYELHMGPVLSWPITSHSTLKEGLYRYDAIGRLQEASLSQAGGSDDGHDAAVDIGRYVRLGPLGTALLPRARPRVLLIDELDKSDIDLPSDLLNVFEEGQFIIDELARLPEEQSVVEVLVDGSSDRVPIERGCVRCHAFPLVVITSNGEREFSPAFLRRCVRLDIRQPDGEKLERIVAAQLGERAVAEAKPLIERFLERRERHELAIDQLLNALYLATSGTRPPGTTRNRLVEAVLRPLDRAGAG